MKPNVILPLLIAIITASCSQSVVDKPRHAEPTVILKDFKSWWSYNYSNINLAAEYIALDTSATVIDKTAFLQSLSSGAYIPLRIFSTDSSIQYQLYRMNGSVDGDIKTQVKQFGQDGYKNFQMEGMELPAFNFTDLNGNVYNNENTKGKTLVLKSWFIHCAKCVEEMSALNTAIRQFSNRPDILFVSLAFDTKENLTEFLKTTSFNYAVVADQKKYLTEQLKIAYYPTHLIINKKGKIVKVIDGDYGNMISCLKKELLK